ncbi:ABC transporter ATP-binding protein [Bhargavaea beijingensis]|uniref:ABC transporter ATP-binding protein n=1 Tax=Bhargavaea beijingensis TaxID=426756 RepID=A0A1G7E4G8_9BACL|nr:ABC transporter ATP-binding protein [Bhargavaea beijingensis]MCW1927504.1 ABC transporter ATP-binding protein [Bhargavaea beijingensis]RSK34939.1 ABC transporter ATP-binding protein [Bhargavaea beijingensis]SDE58583.1 putative ABC transport system ATP-binding protein [Bhargavaea beijingensis]
MPIVSIEDVIKIYEGKVTHRALDRLSFDVEEGEFLAVMGPSGSGKTTLLNLISGIDMPTSGRVLIKGTDPATLRPDDLARFRRRELGFVFQDFNLLRMLTVEENIVLPLTLDRLPVEEMDARVKAITARLGLGGILHKRPDEISGGQEQRVAIARALVHRPSIVLADEPTGNLDSNAAREVLDLLGTINRENRTTFIMVTHDPIAASYCDRVLFIKDGAYYNEIHKDDRRRTFFQRILNMLSLLGGNVDDLSSVRLP